MGSPAEDRIVMHPDPVRLERDLARRVRAAASGKPFSRILVLAPSRRQVLRLRELLARDLGGVVGVDILNYQGLAFRILDRDPGAQPRIASAPLLDSLVGRLLLESRPAELRDYAEPRPAAVAALARLLEELGEAGIHPAELRAASRGARIASLADLLAAYETSVAGTGSGWTDRAGFVRRAVAGASSLPPVRAVFSIGAYELVGDHLDLIRAIPSETGVTFLIPCDPEAPAWEYARAFRDRHLHGRVEPPGGDEPERRFVAAARALAAEEAPTESPLAPEAVRLVHVQGPEAELTFAARTALALLRDGTPAEDVGIVARTLEPFAALAETVFERHGLPVDGSAPLPLTRFPKVRAFLLLVQALARDFERRAVIELTRSPHLERGELTADEGALWWPGAWDSWSRSLALIGGRRAWIEELPDRIENQPAPAWVEPGSSEEAAFTAEAPRRLASAQLLAGLVARWAEEGDRWAACRTAAEHAAFLRDLARRWIHRWNQTDPARPEGSQAVNAAVEQVFLQIEGLEWALGTDSPQGEDARQALPLFPEPGGLPVKAVFDFLSRALETATLPLRNPEGIRFLDFMQARGLTFRHLILIGMNEGLVPRRVREDPFLPDSVRERLRDATGAPLAVRSDGRAEERLLLAATLAAAEDTLTVTWQRSDGNGRAMALSPALRDLVRLLPGAPTLKSILDSGVPLRPDRMPAHPADAATWIGERTGLVSLEEAALLVGERSGGGAPARLRAFLDTVDAETGEALVPGLRMIETVERFQGPGLEYDGRLPGGSGWSRAYSATSLKRMGTCPLTFFFRHVLEVKPLHDEAEAFRVDARELGSSMHKILERVYRDLESQGLLDGSGEADRMVEAARHSLDTHWDDVLEPAAQRIRSRFPLLHAHADAFWRREIREFLDRDLRRLAAGGHRLVSLETAWDKEVSFPAPVLGAVRERFGPAAPGSIPIVGIPDRITRDAEGAWLVSDYKTSGKIAKDVEPKNYLMGHRIQAALYVLLAEMDAEPGAVSAELLGLGPVFAPVDGEEAENQAILTPGTFDPDREGFQETLAVLAAGAETGRFPFRVDRHCDYCDFRLACRRYHYPTRERVEHDEAYRPFFKLQNKGVRKRLLAQIPDDEEDES